jgi:hypothetical protein
MTPGLMRELPRSERGLIVAVYSAAWILTGVWLLGLFTLELSAGQWAPLLQCPEFRREMMASTS